ncbi:MAG: exopolysaccharide biosynthesis polyprenyl glycosylphosphotransferase [Kiritimatiellae bacterium]|nr:exopolysaccharide biosynthesis polyprenyl glycosylphosphotransferase [Kiritimatiellia bacterium]
MFTQGRIRVIALVAADILTVAAVWVAVVLTYKFLGGRYSPGLYLSFWPVPFAFVFTNAMLGLYQGSWMYPSAPVPGVEEMRRLVLSSAITHIAVIAMLVMLFQTMQGYSRIVVAVSGLLVAFLAQSARNLTRITLHRLKIGQIPVVMSGSSDAALALAKILSDDTYTGFRVVGYFDTTTERVAAFRSLGIRYLGSLKKVVPKAKRRDIKILLACQDERLFKLQMEEFASWFTYIEYMPGANTFPVYGSKAISFGGLGGLEMVNQARKKVLLFQKRALDITLATAAFTALLPLFGAIALLIKLTSRGGVFYRQTRLGLHGREFKIWKFRSMYPDAQERLEKLLAENREAAKEWRHTFKLKHDPRITPFGRFLRMTSLDELPQFFNVFAGDMAFIGPRPIVQAEVERYGASYNLFSSVRPGITGLWQVSGRSDIDYTRRVALDTYYVLNWSPWMDFWIMIRTFFAVLLMHGAR